MTRKRIFITSSIAIILVCLLIFFIFFYKAKLSINLSTDNATVKIDNILYSGQKEISISTSPGKHKILVESAGYNTFEKEIDLKVFESKKIDIILEENNETIERAKIEKVSKEFIEAYFTYSKQTDITYLNKIKPFMTDKFYQAESYIFTARPQDYINQSSIKASDIKVIIYLFKTSSAKVVVTFKTTNLSNNKTYDIQKTLELIKVEGSWLVKYLK